MAAEGRDPADPADSVSSLERDIEATRGRLEGNIDQLLHRAHPKTVAAREARSVKAVFVDESGAVRADNVAKAVGAVVGLVVVMVALRAATR